MAKFCGNCGAQIGDDASFCMNCGTPCANSTPAQQSVIPDSGQSAAQNVGQGFNGQPMQNNMGQNVYGGNNYSQPAYNVQPGMGAMQGAKKPVNKSLFIVGGALLLLVAVLVIIICIIAGNGYKKPLDKYVDLIEDGDIKGFVDCIYMEDKDDLYDYIEEVTEDYEYFRDSYGTDIDVSYDIISKKEMPDSYVEAINMFLSDDMKVKKVLTLNVKFTYEYGKNEKVETAQIEVVKTKDGWKISDY